jgi:hypothetical protein
LDGFAGFGFLFMVKELLLELLDVLLLFYELFVVFAEDALGFDYFLVHEAGLFLGAGELGFELL